MQGLFIRPFEKSRLCYVINSDQRWRENCIILSQVAYSDKRFLFSYIFLFLLAQAATIARGGQCQVTLAFFKVSTTTTLPPYCLTFRAFSFRCSCSFLFHTCSPSLASQDEFEFEKGSVLLRTWILRRTIYCAFQNSMKCWKQKYLRSFNKKENSNVRSLIYPPLKSITTTCWRFKRWKKNQLKE